MSANTEAWVCRLRRRRVGTPDAAHGTVRFRRRRRRGTIFQPPLVRLFSEQEKVVLWELRVDDVRMDHVDFSCADLRRSRFTGVSFCGCDFSHANLQDVVFAACDLRGATLADVRLEGASFARSWLTDVEGLTPAQWRYVAERGGLFL
jgi:uncharacterized protein YjbI with pentapeptide repeats